MCVPKNKQILSVVTTLVLLAAFFCNTAVFAECGYLNWIEEDSEGVKIIKNTCDSKTRLAADSELEFSSSSRVWLEFDANPSGEVFQLICQNKSTGTVTMKIIDTAPWVEPQGLKSCGKWENNKLICETEKSSKSDKDKTNKTDKGDKDVDKDTFFCIISNTKKIDLPNMTEQIGKAKSRGFEQNKTVTDIVIKAVEPEIALCKSLFNFNDKLDISWNVSKLGEIKDVVVGTDNKELVGCVKSVIGHTKQIHEINIKHTF